MSVAFPDHDLVEACAEFEANEIAIQNIYDGLTRTLNDEAAAAEAKPLEEKTAALLDRLGTFRASTSAGVHARARLLYAHDRMLRFDWAAMGTVSNLLLTGLLRDASAILPERFPEATPDDDLIITCSDLPGALDSYEQGDDADEGAAGVAYDRIRNAIDAARPLTMAGMVAKARAAIEHASRDPDIDIVKGWRSTPAEGWAWDLLHDLLRLHGGEGLSDEQPFR